MAVENVNVSQSNTGFSANPVELVHEAVKQKQAVKRAVNDVLDDTFEKVTEAATAPVEKTLLNSVAPLRRIVSLPDMVSQGDVAAAIGLGGLTLVSLPEDCRDLRDAYRHSKSVLTRSRFSNAYNYRKYQHDFSFFRGTLLHELMKRAKSPKMKKFVNNVYSLDKTLYNTWVGTLTKKILGIKDGKKVLSKVKNLDGTQQYVQQILVKKDLWGFKDLTARALKRTSVLGLAFMSLLELPKIVKSLKKGEDTEEKIKSGAKQAGRGALNVLGVSIGMGYGGAFGAKKFGAVGSLVGMGAGLFAGCGVSNLIKRLVLPKEKSSEARTV